MRVLLATILYLVSIQLYCKRKRSYLRIQEYPFLHMLSWIVTACNSGKHQMASAWLDLTQWPPEEGLWPTRLPSTSGGHEISRIHPIPVLKGMYHISYKDSDKELREKIPYGDMPVSYKQQPWKHSHSFTQLHPVQLFALISPRESFHFSFQYPPVKKFLNKHLLLWKDILICPGLFDAL